MVDYTPRLLPNNDKNTYFWRNGERWISAFRGQPEKRSKDQTPNDFWDTKAREESKLPPLWLDRVWFPWATPGYVQQVDLDNNLRRIVVRTWANSREWFYRDFEHGKDESYIEQRPAPPVPPFDPLCAYPLKLQEAEPEGQED